jgi:hypothetical protein
MLSSNYREVEAIPLTFQKANSSFGASTKDFIQQLKYGMTEDITFSTDKISYALRKAITNGAVDTKFGEEKTVHYKESLQHFVENYSDIMSKYFPGFDSMKYFPNA